MKKPTRKRVTTLLSLDNKGHLFWNISRGSAKRGALAGTINAGGYRQIRIDGCICYAHHIVWLIRHGYWPRQLDHKDRDKRNNNDCNLRLASTSQNGANSVTRGKIKGVTQKRGHYYAQISVNGRNKFLGSFRSAAVAHAAYAKAAKLHFGEFARP